MRALCAGTALLLFFCCAAAASGSDTPPSTSTSSSRLRLAAGYVDFASATFVIGPDDE